jgi:hypothetical protein
MQLQRTHTNDPDTISARSRERAEILRVLTAEIELNQPLRRKILEIIVEDRTDANALIAALDTDVAGVHTQLQKMLNENLLYELESTNADASTYGITDHGVYELGMHCAFSARPSPPKKLALEQELNFLRGALRLAIHEREAGRYEDAASRFQIICDLALARGQSGLAEAERGMSIRQGRAARA